MITLLFKTKSLTNVPYPRNEIMPQKPLFLLEKKSVSFYIFKDLLSFCPEGIVVR